MTSREVFRILAPLLLALTTACAHRVPRMVPQRDIALVVLSQHVEPGPFSGGFCWEFIATPLALVGTEDEHAVGVGGHNFGCLAENGVITGEIVAAGTYRLRFARQPPNSDERKTCETVADIPPGMITNVFDHWDTQDHCTITAASFPNHPRHADQFPPPRDPTFQEIRQWRTQWLAVASQRCAALPTPKARRACIKHERDLLRWKTRP